MKKPLSDVGRGFLVFFMGLRLRRCAPTAALRCAARCRSAPPQAAGLAAKAATAPHR
jgi:hypothetical protein